MARKFYGYLKTCFAEVMMEEKNRNEKLLYLCIGTVLAIISSLITTIVTKEYEEYRNLKILRYNISDIRGISDKEKIDGFSKKIRHTISYAGRGTASFIISFEPKEEYFITNCENDPKPKELPPTISTVKGFKCKYIITDFRETQEIDFDINIMSNKPVTSDVLHLKINTQDTNLLIKQWNCKYYLDKWYIEIVIMLIVIISVLSVLIVKLLFCPKTRKEQDNGDY